MELSSSLPASPSPGTPLQEAGADRLNQQRDSAIFSSLRSAADSPRDSSVHDKINQFNSLAMHSKHLERKTADAALKRAMLGREEAESEMRRYRDEVRGLRRQVEEGKERERRVGERLETVMENYGRAKETHAHTQSLWEKEIRRARKETFKSQSTIVKLQEELKSARSSLKSTEEGLDREKERSRTREQEAFQARYSLVGLQEQLDEALEKLKMVEQERDAFKTLAKNEEDVARIAAEGRLPLPSSGAGLDGEDEFASPKKKPRVSSINIAEVKSSAASEAEIEELTRLWQWETQRADRALEHVEFLEAECQLKCCPCAKSQPQPSTTAPASPRRKRPEPLKIVDAGDLPILSEMAAASQGSVMAPGPSPSKSKTEKLKEQTGRRSTIFVPKEGIFRTVSQEEAEAIEAAQVATSPTEVASQSSTEPTTPAEPTQEPPLYARTPSVDPPAFALLNQPRASLLSLLDAPHDQLSAAPIINIPTTPGPALPEDPQIATDTTEPDTTETDTTEPESQELTTGEGDAEDDDTLRAVKQEAQEESTPQARPHTVAAFYTEKTTTTTVPLREETTDPSLASRLLQMQRTPSAGSNRGKENARRDKAPALDTKNHPALTPTMTREQALAQIQERRGRARSAAQGAATPRKQMLTGVAASERRDVSAPVNRSARRVRS